MIIQGPLREGPSPFCRRAESFGGVFQPTMISCPQLRALEAIQPLVSPYSLAIPFRPKWLLTGSVVGQSSFPENLGLRERK